MVAPTKAITADSTIFIHFSFRTYFLILARFALITMYKDPRRPPRIPMIMKTIKSARL